MSSEARTGVSSLPKPLSEIGRSEARYLFAIAALSKSDTDRVSTGELRERLDVAAASVTEMVSKLDDRGLVKYEKYQGVTLTERGKTVATRLSWRFCVVSTFFDATLDTTLDDETAFDIGFALPEDGLFRLRGLVDSACLGLCPESADDAESCAV